MKVKFYQIKNIADTTYAFRSWEEAKKNFNMGDYKLVYECERETQNILSNLWNEFNINHPKDFRGYSMSMSDVIALKDKGKDYWYWYYVDEIGWEEITEIVEEYITKQNGVQIMKEFKIKYCQTCSDVFKVKAMTEDEAIDMVREMVNTPEYYGPENFETENYEVIEHKILTGTKFEQGYIPEMDSTVIIKYQYENGELIKETVVGYYHGEPYEGGIKDYAMRGVTVDYSTFN